jgi:hypothetical protein
MVKEVGHCLGFARTASAYCGYCGYCVKGVLRDFNFFGKIERMVSLAKQVPFTS